MQGGLTVLVEDEVTKDDAESLSAQAGLMEKKYGKYLILANLNSNGGSVTAALQIGRILRRAKSSLATVGVDAVCLSSCVYILAGATNRAVDGKVGIHRPYEPDGKETSQTAQKEQYRKLGVAIKTYLAEVNIPLKLFEDQLYISPENTKILSDRELQAYGLNQNDPFAEEADAAKEAKDLGITRAMLASRKAKANQQCPWNGSREKEEMIRLLECRVTAVRGR